MFGAPAIRNVAPLLLLAALALGCRITLVWPTAQLKAPLELRIVYDERSACGDCEPLGDLAEGWVRWEPDLKLARDEVRVVETRFVEFVGGEPGAGVWRLVLYLDPVAKQIDWLVDEQLGGELSTHLLVSIDGEPIDRVRASGLYGYAQFGAFESEEAALALLDRPELLGEEKP